MQIIAGLGNPGTIYCNNRHNVGFMALDTIAKDNGFYSWKKKFNALISEGFLELQSQKTKIFLVKPQTFMNNSGMALAQVLNFYNLSPASLTVIYDDIDLPTGKFRIKDDGGNGGHNGLRSIEAHVGKKYRRLRIGIGHPGDKNRVNKYVLGNFSKDDQVWLAPLLNGIAKFVNFLTAKDTCIFMNKVHLSIANLPKHKK